MWFFFFFTWARDYNNMADLREISLFNGGGPLEWW
jgi:hypothetical protein